MSLRLLTFTALLSFSFPTLAHAQTSTTTRPASQTEALIDSLHLLTQAIKEVVDSNKVSAERMEQLTDAIFRAGATLDSSARLKAEATGGFDWQVFWTAAGVLITAAGFLFVWTQLRFNAWLKAQEIFIDKDFTKARGVVFRRLEAAEKTEVPIKWNYRDKQNIAKLVCRRMDELARLVPFLPKRTALKSWLVPLAKSWKALEPVVRDEQQIMKWEGKWSAFKKLGKEAKEALDNYEPQENKTNAVTRTPSTPQPARVFSGFKHRLF